LNTYSARAALPTVALLVSDELQQRLFTFSAQEQLASFATVIQFPDGRPDEKMLVPLLEQADICITSWDTPPLPTAFFRQSTHLSLIAHAGGTIRHLLPTEIFEHGIHVTQASAALAEGIAEFTVLQTLLCLTQLHTLDQQMKTGSSWHKMREEPTGHLLSAQIVGIVGASRVGREVIKRLRPFGCHIVVYDPYLTQKDADALGVESLDLDTLFSVADIVSLHAPLLPETYEMIGPAQLAHLRDGAILLNTACAHLVEEDALIQELETGRIQAALDVFHEEPLARTHPLRLLPNVLLSPHIAAMRYETLFNQGQMIVDEVQRFLNNEPLRYEILREKLFTLA
jgi:phosphoglycerate dehydrogenase-like enzyme